MKSYINSATVDLFFKRELEKWPLAKQNFEALKMVKTRFIDVDGLKVKVQFNPARRVSTGAKVDPKSIAERPCFLCAKNRPSQQGALTWGAEYKVLVNPFPIFTHHLTIPCTSHVPQLTKGRGQHLIELSRDLEGYAIFYNGAHCGASAPDHMHFQACPKDELPLIAALEQRIPATTKHIEWQISMGFPFAFFILDTAKRVDAEEAPYNCRALFRALDPWTDEADYYRHEPDINVICYESNNITRLLIIPRRAHRPSFYGEGPGQKLISPASVDLGGVFITPRQEDFDSLNADDIRRMYAELCYDEHELLEMIDNI